MEPWRSTSEPILLCLFGKPQLANEECRANVSLFYSLKTGRALNGFLNASKDVTRKTRMLFIQAQRVTLSWFWDTFFPMTHAVWKHVFPSAWRYVYSFFLPWQRKLKHYLASLQKKSFMEENFVVRRYGLDCRGWGCEGALSLKHFLTCWASVSGSLSGSKSSAIRLGFGSSSYLSSTGKKQILKSKPVSPACLQPQVNIIFPDYFFHLGFSSSSSLPLS